MRKLYSATAFFSSYQTILAQDEGDFNDAPDVTDNITINDDGVFEENWDFVPSEVPLKADQMFSCKD